MDALDTFGRPLRDLRISVTDRCNFRCVYCMPKEIFGGDFAFLRRDELGRQVGAGSRQLPSACPTRG